MYYIQYKYYLNILIIMGVCEMKLVCTQTHYISFTPEAFHRPIGAVGWGQSVGHGRKSASIGRHRNKCNETASPLLKVCNRIGFWECVATRHPSERVCNRIGSCGNLKPFPSASKKGGGILSTSQPSC